MGQRSQIYVRITDENKKSFLFARYFQWNFSERMISRARGIMEWLDYYKRNGYLDFLTDWVTEEYKRKLVRIIDTNFDMRDVVESEDIFEWFKDADEYPLKNFVFKDVDNNDGKFFLDITPDSVKFCFTDYNLNILTPVGYMDWEDESVSKGWEWRNRDYKDIVQDNFNYIITHGELMSKKELNSFISKKYKESEYALQK